MLQSNIRARRSFIEADEDVNPLEGAINIVDAMLVFACGLMLSLVIFWNVDLQDADLVPANKAQEVSGIENSTAEMEESVDSEREYEKMGVVYVDPATGKMYLVEEGSGSTPGEGSGAVSGEASGNTPSESDSGSPETPSTD